jgi:phosphohistidine phosphatase
MRELIILRHGKSAWDSDAPSDFQRPLTRRGLQLVPGVGAWMWQNGMRPQTIVSSSALRAWQTVIPVATALDIAEQAVVFDGRLYLADRDTLLQVLSEIPHDINSVLLVGHNPGLEDLVAFLLDDKLPQTDDDRLLPTATVCQVEFDAGWNRLAAGCARLLVYHRPA